MTDDRRTLFDSVQPKVSAEAYAALLARLDMPPSPNERLRKTMQTTAPWEQPMPEPHR